MNDRIHRYLDGELPREALAADELARADEMDAVLARVSADLRAVHAPDLVGRVMAAIPAAAPAPAAPRRPASPWTRAWAWLWNPRPVTVSFRPAYGMLAVAALAFGIQALPVPARDDAGRMAVAAPAAAPPVYVQFRLNAEGARHVSLAGTFTGWKPGYALHETAPGVWTAVVALRPGVHDYAFVVDGRWVSDPTAPQVDDSFGGTNSRIALLPPGDRA